jgi:hypothetical protein
MSETTTPKRLEKKQKIAEFTISIDGKKIISNYFEINDYNTAVKNSINLKEHTDYLRSFLENMLRMKDIQYISDGYDLKTNYVNGYELKVNYSKSSNKKKDK